MKPQFKMLLVLLGAGLLIGVPAGLIARRTHDAAQVENPPAMNAPDAAKGTRQADTDGPDSNMASVGTGPGKVILSLKLPDGYEVNKEAPTKIVLQVDGKVVRFESGETSRQFDKPSFPLEVAVEIAAGEGMVSADMRVYYCREGEEAACFFKEARMELPVRAEAGGKEHSLSVVYEVKR